jgi:hypothetical protein
MSAPEHQIWDDVANSTLRSWLSRTFEPCACDPFTMPAGRCNRHVEFLWRKRFKEDLVTQFVRSEPWLQKLDRLNLRDMMVSNLQALGFDTLLANTSAAKARVAFPDGKVHRITGIALGIRRRHGDQPVVAVAKPVLPGCAADGGGGISGGGSGSTSGLDRSESESDDDETAPLHDPLGHDVLLADACRPCDDLVDLRASPWERQRHHHLGQAQPGPRATPESAADQPQSQSQGHHLRARRTLSNLSELPETSTMASGCSAVAEVSEAMLDAVADGDHAGLFAIRSTVTDSNLNEEDLLVRSPPPNPLPSALCPIRPLPSSSARDFASALLPTLRRLPFSLCDHRSTPSLRPSRMTASLPPSRMTPLAAFWVVWYRADGAGS